MYNSYDIYQGTTTVDVKVVISFYFIVIVGHWLRVGVYGVADAIDDVREEVYYSFFYLFHVFAQIDIGKKQYY